MEYARMLTTGDMLPAEYRGKPGNALIAIGLGQSMGLSPAESLYRIAVIKGRPTASAELIASNVRRAGHKLRVELGDDYAVASIWRSDDPEFAFTVRRDAAWAKGMGLDGNDNYRKQPVTMYANRAITACARLACPEALYGVSYVPEEMGDLPERGGTVTVAEAIGEVVVERVDTAPQEPVDPVTPSGKDTQAGAGDTPATEEQIATIKQWVAHLELSASAAKATIVGAAGRKGATTANLTRLEAQAVIDELRGLDAPQPDPTESLLDGDS
jgi:hypothetical protein